MIESILIILTVVLLCLFVWHSIQHQKFSSRLSQQADSNFNQTQKLILESIRPHFVEMNPEAKSMFELAGDIWKLEQRIGRLSDPLTESQRKGLENTVQRLKRFLSTYDIEFKDYTDARYHDGLNVDVMSIQQDGSTSDGVVKETVEPALIHKGQVVKKAKVIISKGQ